MIYHITTRDAWQDALKRGSYSAPSLRSEGFIHCSAREQVLAVADAIYAGAGDLLLLCIDESRLEAELVWEAPAHPESGGLKPPASDSPFPHIYGRLNLDAVVAAHDLVESADGFELPPELP